MSSQVLLLCKYRSILSSEKCSETGCRPGHHDIELVLGPESFIAFTFFLIPIFEHFQSKAVFAHLCLEVRSYTASWYRAYLPCQTPESCFQFRIERADASHWIVCYTFFASDVNAWTRCNSLNRCDVCRSSCGGNIETLRFQLLLL